MLLWDECGCGVKVGDNGGSEDATPIVTHHSTLLSSPLSSGGPLSEPIVRGRAHRRGERGEEK